MFQAIGRHVSLPARAGIAALLNPRFTASTLKLMGAKGRTFSPLLRNTVNPTSVRGGGQINVVPDGYPWTWTVGSCRTSRRSC